MAKNNDSGNKVKKPLMGKITVTIGVILKILQIILTAVGNSSFGGSAATVISICFLTGGFCIIGIERKKKAMSWLAFVAAFGTVLSVVDTGYDISVYIALFLTFTAFSLTVLFSGSKRARILSIVSLLLTATAAAAVFGSIHFPKIIMVELLVLIYSFMAVELYI